MFCPNCGNNCPDNVNNCPNCGHAFAQAQQPQYQAPQQPYGQAPYGQAPYGQQPYGYPPVQPKGNTAVLVLGIVGLVCSTVGCCCSYIIIPGLICAIIGIILGVKAKKELAPGVEDKNVKTGLILSYIALGVGILMLILAIVGLALMGSAGLLDYMDYMY